MGAQDEALDGACAELARWLAAVSASVPAPVDPAGAGVISLDGYLLAEPDEDGHAAITGRAGSSPPWNDSAAGAIFTATEGARRLEASLRLDVTGKPGRRRGGSDGNTTAAIKAISQLGQGVTRDAAGQAAVLVERWAAALKRLRAIDELPVWRRLPGVRCPYCECWFLWVAAASGMVACWLPSCTDGDGNRPMGRLDMSLVTHQAVLAWADGTVQ